MKLGYSEGDHTHPLSGHPDTVPHAPDSDSDPSKHEGGNAF